MSEKKQPSYFSQKSNPKTLADNKVDETYISQLLKSNKIADLDVLIKNYPDLTQDLIQKIIIRNFGNIFNIFIPGKGFSSLSVTGSSCELRCDHCNLKYLTIMKDISDETKLKSELDDLIRHNSQGCLVSGGCTNEGKVPFLKFKQILQEYREKSNLIFNFHVGLLSEQEVQQLAELNPHIVSFDITLDENIIQNIYHLKGKISRDYTDTFENLLKYKINVIPHITIGLNLGEIRKEIDTLRYLSQFDLDLIVFIILIPPESDPRFKLPKVQDIEYIFKFARLLFPTTELSLGCMRPRGKLHVDIEHVAIKSGINRIVIPASQTLNLLKSNNATLNVFDACCAIPLNLYRGKYKKL